MNIAELITGLRERFAAITGRYYGLYRGRVVANNDEEGLYRLRLSVPAVWGEAESRTWAWPMFNPATSGAGLWALPEPGELVWVAFEEGDPNLPVWGYGHWNKKMVPPKPVAGCITLTTAKGELLELNPKTNRAMLSNGKAAVAVKEGMVHLGNPDGTGHEPAVMGKQLHSLLSELCQTLATENAGGYPLAKAAKYAAIKARLDLILSQHTTLWP